MSDYVKYQDRTKIFYKRPGQIRLNKREKTELFKVILADGTSAMIKALLNTAQQKHKSRLFDEIAVIKHLNHENIIRYKGHLIDDENGTFMTEFACLGSLDELITEKPDSFDDTKFCSLSTQACEALDYLHARSPAIVHGGIRSRNVFITKGPHSEWILKLAEFGESKAVRGAESSSSTIEGNGEEDYRRWLPLEVLRDGEASPKSDMWSLFVLFAEILLKQTRPFPHIDGQIQLRIIEELEDNKKPFVIPPTCPQPLQALFTNAWEKDPSKRPPASDVLNKLQTMQEQNVAIMPSEGGAVGGHPQRQ